MDAGTPPSPVEIRRLMKHRLAVVALVVASGAGLADAAVIVVANRTEREVAFTITLPKAQPQPFKVPAGGLTPVPVVPGVVITFTAGKDKQTYQLDPNAVYYFADTPNGLLFSEMGFGPNNPARNAKPPAGKPDVKPAVLKIPVKILVDQGEAAAPKVWEARLRKRLEAASDVFEKHCRVRFEVVAVGTWESDNRLIGFDDLLRDFEGKVVPKPARIALGFTSNDRAADPQLHMGGTRGALNSHVLIREWLQVSEPERLELLLHELGHHLGAVHSPEGDSVMRPKLVDGRAAARSFRIGFDPMNTLVMNLVAEDLRARPAARLRDLSPAVKERLIEIYGEVAKATPDDKIPTEYVAHLKQTAETARQRVVRSHAEGARVVVAAVVEAAVKRPKLSGDALTDHYVRAAAAAARDLPAEHAVGSFLLGLGFALDDSDLLRQNPLTRNLASAIETEEERKRRLEVLGSPTLRGRRDLAQHFVVSCALTVLVGPKPAESAGILKELLDARAGGSGFSFADLAADMAGIAFANQMLDAKAIPEALAAGFTGTDYMPDVTGLREGISQEDFVKDYGSNTDKRFYAQQALILQRILTLPGHKGEAKKKANT
jgi:hypothetical protein